MEQISQTISVINATSAFIILLSATAEQKDLRLFFSTDTNDIQQLIIYHHISTICYRI
jgi:hypothetical protein